MLVLALKSRSASGSRSSTRNLDLRFNRWTGEVAISSMSLSMRAIVDCVRVTGRLSSKYLVCARCVDERLINSKRQSLYFSSGESASKFLAYGALGLQDE